MPCTKLTQEGKGALVLSLTSFGILEAEALENKLSSEAGVILRKDSQL